MERFTVTEINWIMAELEKAISRAEDDAATAGNPANALLELKAANLSTVSEKLYRVISSGDKRIAVARG